METLEEKEFRLKHPKMNIRIITETSRKMIEFIEEVEAEESGDLYNPFANEGISTFDGLTAVEIVNILEVIKDILGNDSISEKELISLACDVERERYAKKVKIVLELLKHHGIRYDSSARLYKLG